MGYPCAVRCNDILGTRNFGETGPVRPPGTPPRPGRFSEPSGAGPAAPSSSVPTAEPLPRSSRSFAPAVKPTPLPKRSKGRLLVGAVMSATLGILGYFVWDTWFRYEALGTVVGRVVQVSSPLAGTVESTRVRQGDVVRQGEPLATVRNLELQHRLAASGDQLRIAQATLEAELAKLRWRSHTLGSDNRKAMAEYYEVWGTFLSEQAKLADLELKLQRARILAEREAISAGEHDTIRLETEGQRAKVEKLAVAVEAMRHRAELDAQLDETEAAQLKPLTAATETLPSEIERLRLQVDQGEIVAPVDGRIIARQHYAGEYVDQGECSTNSWRMTRWKSCFMCRKNGHTGLWLARSWRSLWPPNTLVCAVT